MEIDETVQTENICYNDQIAEDVSISDEFLATVENENVCNTEAPAECVSISDEFLATIENENICNTEAPAECVSISDEFLVQHYDTLVTEHQSFYDCIKTCKEPTNIFDYRNDFSNSENFLRGTHWSPCGNQLLSLSNDNMLRVFNFSHDDRSQVTSLDPLCNCPEGDLVYDYCWYPGSNVNDPQTCCFVTSSKGSPIHLWDSLHGFIRCSYRAYNHVDELTAPYSLSFDLYGEKLYCGFEKMVRVFDIGQPGREFETRKTFVDKEGQSGIISCFAFNPASPSMYACGSYSKSIGIYYEPQGSVSFVLEGHRGGVTHLKFSEDGNYLFSGGRKDPEILCWDLRNPGKLVFVMKRKVETNQRIYFDFDPSFNVLMSGGHDGKVSFWDVSNKELFTGMESEPLLPPLFDFTAHMDTVNSISCHPTLPIISTGSGQRHFYQRCFSDSEGSDTETESFENSIKLWKFDNNNS